MVLLRIDAQARRTPLHCLAMRPTAKKEALLYLLERCGEATRICDVDGRSVLHWICELQSLDLDVLERVLAVCASSANDRDAVR